MDRMLNNYLHILIKREKMFRESEEEIDLIYRMDDELIEGRGGNRRDDFRREDLDFTRSRTSGRGAAHGDLCDQ